MSDTPTITLHGVLMEVQRVGVLITGPSGIGKSELALELITRRHRLIADDCPQFQRDETGQIIGMCPPTVQDFLEVRGLGIINVRAMFSDTAIAPSKPLCLIIKLIPLDEIDINTLDRLHGTRRHERILGLKVPEITLPVTAGRNLAVLLETAVREHLLRQRGYNGSDDFDQRQQAHIHAQHAQEQGI